jgi:hypothetical protein
MPSASAGAFDILEEIDRGIAAVAYRAIADSPNDLLKRLFLPSAVGGFRERHNLSHKIIKAVDFGRSSPSDRIDRRNDFVYRYFLNAVFDVRFRIRLVPSVSRGLLVGGAAARKISVDRLLSLWRRSRASVVFHRIALVGERWKPESKCLTY